MYIGRLRWFSLAVLGMTVMLACTGCGMLKDLAPTNRDTSNVRDWVVIPIFYRTNRLKKPNAGKFAYEEELNSNRRTFGVKNVVVPLPANEEISKESMEKLGWQAIHLEKSMGSNATPALPDKPLIAEREIPENEIIQAFDDYRRRAGTNDVLIFAHGCCATFQTSAERAAKIAVVMQEPIVLYDWVSPVGFTHYLKNETLARQEMDDFTRFLRNCEKLIPPSSTTLMGHSMGAMFVDDALVRRSERECKDGAKDQYREILFSNPDVDARTYLNHQDRIKKNAQIVRIFFSPSDGRLKNSAMAHGSCPRLGRPEVFLPELCKTDGQDLIDVTDVGMGHEVPFTIVGDIHRTGKVASDSGYEMVESGSHLYAIHKRLGAKALSPLMDLTALEGHQQRCRCQ